MISPLLINKFEPLILINIYTGLYKSEYGTVKLQNIVQRVVNSTKINELHLKLVRLNTRPGSGDYYYLVNTIPYFYVAKAETMCAATLVAISLWYNLALKHRQSPRKEDLLQIISSTITRAEETKYPTDNDKNFFFKLKTILSGINSGDIDVSNFLADVW